MPDSCNASISHDLRPAGRRLSVLAMLATAGCSASVDYGPVRHADYIRDPRCVPAATDEPATPAQTLFLATSRLPDCRIEPVSFTSFRSTSIRFARFSPPDPNDKRRQVDLSLQAESRWWSDLEAAANNGGGRVLVYVHGYRETLFTTSRDTAQIARLTGFKGAVIQYSWPSQGDLIRYAVDETNMYWDERNFRRFLQTLASRPWVREIVLVSHSLGARLVIPAVEFVDANSPDRDSSNISNIILASPDVDREDFERDIAEEVLSARRVNHDRRITVYASAGDRALALSRALHGYPRLGSPYCFNPFEAADLRGRGLPERCYATKSAYDVPPSKSGFTIVDTTDVSRRNSGHSDFLHSGPACRDFSAVAGGGRNGGPDRRPTHLAHVFRLERSPDAGKEYDAALCRKVQ